MQGYGLFLIRGKVVLGKWRGSWMFQSRVSRIIGVLIVLCAGVGGGIIYFGRVQPPESVTVHHVVAAPEQKVPAGGVTLPDMVPSKP